jgi:hypothetical protein
VNRFDSPGAFFLAVLMYCFACLPGATAALVGIWLSRRISKKLLRIAAFAALSSIAIAPGVPGHLTPFPALWTVVLFSGRDRLIGALSLLGCWVLAIPVAAWADRHLTQEPRPS